MALNRFDINFNSPKISNHITHCCKRYRRGTDIIHFQSISFCSYYQSMF